MVFFQCFSRCCSDWCEKDCGAEESISTVLPSVDSFDGIFYYCSDADLVGLDLFFCELDAFSGCGVYAWLDGDG